MGYSSVDTVGRDVYGFLDFLSRRQGPKDTTNPQPPEPPQQVAAADAGAVAPGATMPGTVMDTPAPTPFVKPLPVSSKPVQVAGPATAAATPAPPKPVVPEPPKSGAPAPALTSDAGTQPGTPAAKLPPAFDPNAPKLPAFDPSTGKIDVMGILKQQQDAANRMRAMEGIARGGTLMAAAATRSPSMRAVLAGAAGGGHAGGGGGGEGELSAATLLELDKRSRAEAAAGYKAKIAPQLAKHLGVPPEMIQFMDDDKIATLTTAIAKGENLRKEERADGSVFWTNLTTGETYGTLSPDQIKVQKAADEHAQSQATTGKVTEETAKLQEEAKQRALATGNIPELSKAFGVPEKYLETLGPEGLKQFIADRLKKSEPTEAQKTLDGINKQRVAAGQPAITDEEWYKRTEEEKIRIARETAGYGTAAKDVYDTARKADEANTTLDANERSRRVALAAIRTGRTITGSPLSPGMLAAKKLIAGWGRKKEDDITDTEIIGITAAQEVLQKAASGALPGPLSDSDREFLNQMSGGNIQLDAETIRRAININRWASRSEREQHDKTITQLRKEVPEGWPRTTQPRGAMGIDADMYRYTDNTYLHDLFADRDGPGNFDGNYGQGAADDVAKNADKVFQEKMSGLGKVKGTLTGKEGPGNTYSVNDKETFAEVKAMNPATFEASRAIYDGPNGLFEKKYGSQGRGLFDAMLAAKNAGRF